MSSAFWSSGAAFVLFALVGCASASSETADREASPIAAFAKPTGASPVGCSDEAKVPYVLSRGGYLYRFDPPALAFTKIGKLGCSMVGSETVISMAIDRQDTAWVSTTSGGLLKVGIKDASCERVAGFQAGSFGWTNFGMGFSTDAAAGSAASADETLFISELTGDATLRPSQGLGRLGAKLDFTAIGNYGGELQGASAELTGTGDGRLFAFLVQDGTRRKTSTLVQLDKESGAVLETTPLALKVAAGYAFSFWGGDFWFYTTDPDAPTASSQVTHLRYATDKSEKVVTEPIGFDVVGAGVSTCAPTTPVK